MDLYFGIISLIFFILFFILYKINKARVIVGFVFDIFLVFLAITCSVYVLQQGNLILYGIIFVLWFIVLFIIAFGIYALIIFLFLNARKVFKKESRSLSNSLTFILAIILSALCIFGFIAAIFDLPKFVMDIWMGIFGVLFFYFFHILVFFTTIVLCNLTRPKKNLDYIIVLGSGLINDKISPLLKGRVDRAITVYNKIKAKNPNSQLKLVLSGGQGEDEAIPESHAMKEYALSMNVKESDILVEDKSKTTLENMKFSKEIMDENSKGKSYNCIFATSNYHVLRASIYARQVGLNIDGIGSKTAYYFLPNALLREYIAFCIFYKKTYAISAIIIFVLTYISQAIL